MKMKPCAFALVVAICGCASGASGRPVTAGHDSPVPDSVPRGELALKLDLEPAADCEQNFDLELYRDHSVDLIKWDDKDGKCSGRSVVIRYLSNDVKPDELFAKVQKLARKVERSDKSADKSGKEASR